MNVGTAHRGGQSVHPQPSLRGLPRRGTYLALMNGDTSDMDGEGSEPYVTAGRQRGTGGGWTRWGWILAIVLGAGGCAGSAEHLASDVIRVFAASSLTEAMTDLGAAFEASHPDRRVILTFGGSQILRLQISQGARVDVFASANQAHLSSLTSEGLIERQQVLAESALALIVPAGESSPVTTFRDLPLAERIVVGSGAVPIGAYTHQLLERAEGHYGTGFRQQVLDHVVSEEGNVRLVRAKVELGEADAAIVYSTDARSSTRTSSIPIPSEVNVHVTYVVGGLADPANPTGREELLRWLETDRARRILLSHGFSLPSS